jgi:uncharacterized protein YjbI with pentapeptide repeats
MTAHSTATITFGRAAPGIFVRNIESACAFYSGVLGFRKTFENGSPVGFVILEKDKAELHLSLIRDHRPSTSNVAHLLVDDVDALHAVCVAAGVKIIRSLADKEYGLRAFVFADPDGNRIDVGQPIARSAETGGAAENADKAAPQTFEHAKSASAIFRDCGMAGSRFDDVNLSSSGFSNVSLQGARFTNVNLSGVSIDDARMASAVFKGCAMASARFDDVNLSSSEFSNVSFQGARFTDVNLSGVSVDDAQIDGLKIFGLDIQALIHAELKRNAPG